MRSLVYVTNKTIIKHHHTQILFFKGLIDQKNQINNFKAIVRIPGIKKCISVSEFGFGFRLSVYI